MTDISIANKRYFIRHYKIFQSKLLVIRLLRALKGIFPVKSIKLNRF